MNLYWRKRSKDRHQIWHLRDYDRGQHFSSYCGDGDPQQIGSTKVFPPKAWGMEDLWDPSVHGFPPGEYCHECLALSPYGFLAACKKALEGE